MTLWDTFQGSPMAAGPQGERWCVEHQPTGNVASKEMHFPNWREALRAYRALASGKPDEWGFWEAVEPVQVVQYVSQTRRHDPRGGMVQSTASEESSAGLSTVLRTTFSHESISDMLREICEATRQTESGPVPDWAVRKEGLKLLLAYQYGLPIQRKEEVARRESTDGDVIARLATKPGYRSAVRNYIEALEQKEAERLGKLGRK